MLNRRIFLRSSAALTALASHSSLAAWFPTTFANSTYHPLHAFIVDRNIVSSAAFAIAAQRVGTTLQVMDGDPGGIWMHEIEPYLKKHPAAIAGYTGGPTLFCLEFLARDYGLHLVYRIAHSQRKDGSFEHAFSGPLFSEQLPLKQRSEKLAATIDNSWCEHAVALAISCPTDVAMTETVEPPTLCDAAEPASPVTYSWLLAPNMTVPKTRG